MSDYQGEEQLGIDYVVTPNKNPNIRALYTMREGHCDGYISGIYSRPVIGWGKFGHAIIPGKDGEPLLAMNGEPDDPGGHPLHVLEFIYGMDEPETYPPAAEGLLGTTGH